MKCKYCKNKIHKELVELLKGFCSPVCKVNYENNDLLKGVEENGI